MFLLKPLKTDYLLLRQVNDRSYELMNEILLLKLGELVLKGLNRKLFENVLLKRIQYTLCDLGKFDIKLAQSTITIVPQEETIDLEEAAERVSKIFGIAAFSRARVTEKNMDAIKQASAEYLAEELEAAKTFKVEAKRSDKKFPLNSPQICTQVGEYLLEAYPHLTVDVHNPDSIVYVEVRDYGAYIRGRALQGAGGIPVGTGGKAAVLISGGIDSPVASWMMAKRGVELTAIHFASPPYTSERAEDKVVRLLTQVSAYSGRMKMYTVPFTKVQELIQANCPEELFTIIMRRFMMRVAEQIARKEELADSTDNEKYRIYGELLTANLHNLEKGMKTADVFNYYDGSTVTVKLDPRLTGNQNAQKYYKEYKKKQTAVKVLTDLIAKGEIELEYLKSVEYAVNSAKTEAELMLIRSELHDAGYLKY